MMPELKTRPERSQIVPAPFHHPSIYVDPEISPRRLRLAHQLTGYATAPAAEVEYGLIEISRNSLKYGALTVDREQLVVMADEAPEVNWRQRRVR
jgi:hypothetical protein